MLLEKNSEGWYIKKKYEGFTESSRVMAFDERNILWMSHGYKGVYAFKFSEDLLVDLSNRMETPNPNNRWDSPLYTIWPHEELPIEAINGSLFKEKKKMKDPVSTKLALKLDQNYAYKVDQKLNQVIKDINKKLMENKQFLKQKFIIINKDKQKFEISSKIGLTHLKKTKNDFVEMNKINPVFDLDKLESAFLYFLQTRN